MNFVHQIITLLFYLLLLNQNIFMTTQNDIVFDLDKEYTNLMLLSNFDSVKQPGIEEEQIHLERKMQFRIIAWNFVEKYGDEQYGLEKEKKKIAANKKGQIKNMIKYACELWTKTVLKDENDRSKIIQGNPELVTKERKAFRKHIEQEPMSLKEISQMSYGDCDRLESYLLEKSADPFEEMPKWINKFFKSVNELHYQAIIKLLNLKEFEEYKFDLWWKKFQKRKEELRDEKQLKKALELEDEEAKMGRSKAIIPFNGSKQKQILVENENQPKESQFLRELRKLALNSITKDGQGEMKLVKRQILKMTSADTLIKLENYFPTLFGIGTIEEQEAFHQYKIIVENTTELMEYRISATFLYGRIWRKLFDQLFDNQENEENIRAHLKQLFEISKQFFKFENFKNFTKSDAQKMCLELLKLWRKIMNENESHEKAEEIEENFEQNKMLIRKELLWKEHWAWLDLAKKMDKQLLDSDFSPGNIYNFSEFFGGFEQIWSKIIEMEKYGQKPLQLDRFFGAENMDYKGENFMDKMLAPFRTKLTDVRINYYIEDYFEKILLIESDSEILKFQKAMWKTTSNIKRSNWGLDLLIWMLILDEYIDEISSENDQLVNAWYNARVEMEIFHDSLAIREKGYERVEKPALYMLNWMYLLRNQKCITKNDAKGKSQIGEFDEEENRKEMNKNLINYIEKCKNMAKEYTEKEKTYFDEDEMRKRRWLYLQKIIKKEERFYSPHIAETLEDKIEDRRTLEKIENLIGSEFLAELTNNKLGKNLSVTYFVEKWIEIFKITDKKKQFQDSLEFMYSLAKQKMKDIKNYTKKLQINIISFKRESARNFYDAAVRIDQQIDDVLGMEKKDKHEIATSSRTKKNENSSVLNRQINLIRCIKLANDLFKMVFSGHDHESIAGYNFNEIQMVSSEFVQSNFHQLVEELRNRHMKNLDFKRFARVLQLDSELVQSLRNEEGAVYRLNTLLGLGYDDDREKELKNIDTVVKELTLENATKRANEVKKEKRNIEKVWHEASNGAGNNLDNPLRDVNFFNDKRLMENYVSALKNYKLKGENSPSTMYSLAANILVFMQHFEQLVMRSGKLLPKIESIRSKYGEQIRLFARIEYDKVLDDFGQVKFHFQREFFARLLAEINSGSKREMIPEILQNYRLEKIVIEENDKIFKDYDNNLRSFHSKALVRLLRQEMENKKKEEKEKEENKDKKEENKGKKKDEEENKGKKEGKELSIEKLLRDTKSNHGRREILFNFIDDYEPIENVFKEMKIQAKSALVVKKAEEEMENQNEQVLRKVLPESRIKAKNLSTPQIVVKEQREPSAGVKSWAAIFVDSDDSDNEGKGRKKNVQIQEIVKSGNEQQQIEEIGSKKKESVKVEEKETILKKEGTSSNPPKGKKKKKVRFQNTGDEEASSNSPPSTNQNDVPAEVDVASGGDNGAETTEEEASLNSTSQNDVVPKNDVASGSGAETISKSKKKNERKKKNKIQQNAEKAAEKERKYGEVTILKRGEKEEEVGEMVTLPSNEIAEQKMNNSHKLTPFEKYFDDQFLYNKILAIYEKFTEQQWSPEEHLFLTVGAYLNEIDHKLKALNEMKKGKMQMLLPKLIDWKLVEELQKELTELKLNEEKEWTLKELNVLMEKLHIIFTKLLAQIDGYSNGKEKDEEKSFDRTYLRLQLNWICFARAICEEQKFEIWSVKDVKKLTNNRNFVVLIGQQPIIVVEEGEKKNQLKLNDLEKLRAQFEREYLDPYKKMLQQNALDHQLLNEYSKNYSAPQNEIPIESNKLVQQFRWSSDQIRQTRVNTQQIRDIVYNVVVNDDEDEAEEPSNRQRHQQVDIAIRRIKEIITKIWAPQSTLKIGGSYQLGTWTPNSDIDGILIASKRVGKTRFFGKSTCESNRWCLDIDSLFCQLCQNKNIFHLVRYPNNHIPHLKFTYCTHFERHQMDFDRSKLSAFQCSPFELVLISMPGYGIISEKTLQNTQLLIEQFREKGEEDIYEIDWNDSRSGMIQALSGYQMNEFILAKLVNKNMLRVFRICLVTLKKWAQNNYIYGGQYGYLNDASLGLMLLKILLRFPITPMVPFILEQFFVNFVNWPWPMPVQFALLGADKTEAFEKKLGWQADREKGQKQKMLQSKVRHVEGWQELPTLNMPIISPCKPERNVAYNVNHSTHQIIQEKLQLGLEMIEKILGKYHQQDGNAIIKQDANANNYSWKSLLDDKKTFGEKYTHYIVFFCFAKNSSESSEQRDLGEKFCGEYVLYQLRHQLIFSIENPSVTGIKRCHILPNINMEKQQKNNLNELSRRKLMAVPLEFRWNSLNRYWIIGLEFAKNDKGAFFGRADNYAEKLENWMNKSQFGFVEKFIQDYINFSIRKHSSAEIRKKLANINLYAKFVPKEQLAQWTIKNPNWRPKEQKELN